MVKQKFIKPEKMRTCLSRDNGTSPPPAHIFWDNCWLDLCGGKFKQKKVEERLMIDGTGNEPALSVCMSTSIYNPLKSPKSGLLITISNFGCVGLILCLDS